MACQSVVRLATVNDNAEIWRLCLEANNENAMFKIAPQKVQWLLNRMLMPELIPPGDTGLRGVIGVIGPEGALEAICGLVVSEIWYTEEKHLADFLVFVDPTCRKSNHAVALVNWMKQQSDSLGMVLMSAVVSNHKTEAKCRLYRRMLPKIGESFIYPNVNGFMSEQNVNRGK